VDGQTLEDGTVTIRDRDTLKQDRIGKDHVLSWLNERLGGV
jgi:glycyl-tRNA synthetase